MIYFKFNQILWAVLVTCLSFIFCTNSLQAHGLEGDRFFPPTIQTDDPFATDELAVGVQGITNPASDYGATPKIHEIDISTGFTKEIFPKFALSIGGTYSNYDPSKHTMDGSAPPPSFDGFQNIELGAKYQAYENPKHEFIFSVGCLADLGGTGSKPLGVDSFTTYTPTLYFGKGFGDLPNELKYLKPFAVTSTVGLAIPGESYNPDGSYNSDALQYGAAVEYSLPYLQEHVEDIGLPNPFKEMIPLVELNLNSPLDRSGTTTTGTINPGVLWEGKYCQLGAEAIIPLNNHSGPEVGAVFQVQIYIDDIFPKIFGHPLLGDDDNDADNK